MNSRREFIRSSALGATAATIMPQLFADPAPADRSLASHARVTKRPITEMHRNLFNGDCCVFFYNPERWQPEGGPFSAKAIFRYVENLQQNGIDTFVINPNASKAWYPSKTLPSILDGYTRGDREFFRGHAISDGPGFTKPEEVETYIDTALVFYNRYLDLIEAGVDWLAESTKACRQHGVTPWASIRMNDMHGNRNFEGSFFNHPLLKRPEMRLQRTTYPSKAGGATYTQGLNYEHQEVRDMMFEQIREIVEDYDFEGLELDWWRNPLCCEPNATAATVAMMSDWFREIRVLTQLRAKKIGRPYYLGMRMPENLETLRSIAIDIESLAHDGSLDFLCPSAFWRTAWDMPHDDLRRQLGEDIAIYGVIEDGANSLPTVAPDLKLTKPIRFISATREMLYANAAGKLVLGADGIEWFNFYCTDDHHVPGLTSNYTFLPNIHKLEYLRGQPKHYALADRGFMEHAPFEAAPQVPVLLERNWRTSFRLPMCAEPLDRGLELMIQVIFKKADAVGDVPVMFNGSWPKAEYLATDELLFPCGPFTHHIPEHTARNFNLPISLIQEGWNEIVIENGAPEPITIVGVELAVKKHA